MKRTFLCLLLSLLVFAAGCGGSNRSEVESFIQEAFKARADAVFLYKDKENLGEYFDAKALEQSKEFLAWKPMGEWDNAKNLKYAYSIRIGKVKIDGKVAQAEVYETAIVTWESVEPAGTTVEDAWSNRKHLVTLMQDPEGLWMVDQDIIGK